jgi:sec-independent protein translocase protein TatA
VFKAIGWPEIIVILVVVVLVFGVGRISKIGGEIGSGIRAFKQGLSGEKDDDQEHNQEDSSDEV